LSDQRIPAAGARAVPGGRGEVAIVDEADWERVGKHSWHLFPSRNTFYAARWVRVFMHREVMQAETPLDHKNGNGLDNRRSNLRPASGSQNAQNQQKWSRPTSSRFKGVHWNKRDKKWIARIGVEKRRINLGSFHDEEDAARAYDAAAKQYFGEYARLNFPRLPRAIHACNDGWVTIGQIAVDPETGEETEEYALYLCRKCTGRS